MDDTRNVDGDPRLISGEFDHPLDLYVGEWMQYLAYGHVESHLPSFYALRSHGVDIWTDGYWENVKYKISHKGHSITITPDQVESCPG